MGLTPSAVRLVNVRAGGAKAAAAPRQIVSSKRCIFVCLTKAPIARKTLFFCQALRSAEHPGFSAQPRHV